MLRIQKPRASLKRQTAHTFARDALASTSEPGAAHETMAGMMTATATPFLIFWCKPSDHQSHALPIQKNSRPFDANSPSRFGTSAAGTSAAGTWAAGSWAAGMSHRLESFMMRMQRHKWLFAAALLIGCGLMPWPAQAASSNLKFGEQKGSVSGLPLPRFVSLKADRVNLREGPSRDHRTTWVFQRAGLPVEVTAEFDVWCRVRDSEGTEGWVLHSLLSGRRTALVAPWKKAEVFTLLAQPEKNAAPVAKLQSGVIATLKSCDGNWCHISGDGFDGYLAQTSLWGVYPNEKLE
jgi:SH3-like domain-containing protein